MVNIGDINKTKILQIYLIFFDEILMFKLNIIINFKLIFFNFVYLIIFLLSLYLI